MKKTGLFLFVVTQFFLSILLPLGNLKPAETYQAFLNVVPDITQSEYVSYSDRESELTRFAIPDYTSETQPNSCGPISGAIICGYYDVFYPDVVPNFVTSFNGPYGLGFYSSHTKIDRIISKLMTYMCVVTGVTVANYKSGLSDYFYLFAGLTVTYNSVKQGNSLNFNACKTEIDAGRPIAIFMSLYNNTNYFQIDPGFDGVNSYIFINNHIFTASGYETVNYYRIENGVEVLFRTDNYLYVQTGWGYSGYMCVDRNLTINDAYGVAVS